MNPIIYWNRDKNCAETEAVYGGDWLERFYCNPLVTNLTGTFLANKTVSQLYGAYKSSHLSRAGIASFIDTFSIPMQEYLQEDYASFNDFFIRRFSPNSRPFTNNPHDLAAFAEARYFAFDALDSSAQIPVKGIGMTAAGLLNNAPEAKRLANGPCLLARLCPVDYHRFHFPDDGKILRSFDIAGQLHSVNPIALSAVGNVLHTNHRHVSFLETKNFGLLAYIEVGALCVGKIVQSHTDNEFKRGQEKGYFLFGGSTVIVLGEPGRWRPDSDLTARTKNGQETLTKLGTRIATV